MRFSATRIFHYADKANLEIEKSFQNGWQDRVKSILIDYAEHPGLVTYIFEEK